MEYMILTAVPWFEPNTFGAYYGAIGGGIGGPLIGVLAPLSMFMAQRGKARAFVVVLWGVIALAGIAQLVFSGYALANAQPYAIWYPPALCGFLFTVLSSVFWVQVQRRYAQTEARKLDAAGFRHS
jgi:hypothetical protein